MLAQLGHQQPPSASPNSTPIHGTSLSIPRDESQASTITALGIEVTILPTVMKTRPQKRKLARASTVHLFL